MLTQSLRTYQTMLQGKWLPEQLTWLRNDRYWKYQRLAFEIIFEIILVVVFLKAYNLVRNQFGSQKCSPQYALGHALQVIRAEEVMGIFWEQEIQALFINYPRWIRFWNIFYGTAHMAVTIFVLIFLFILKPAAYQQCRTIFLVMNVLAIVGYASYPLMPPRLVNDCEDAYGGCTKDYSFVDTMEEIGGLWSWKQKSIAKVTNHYAAMPSMHAGYSIWSSISMYGHSPYAAFRVLAVIYPLLTIYCIVVTANHFFLDAVFGALALAVASKVASWLPQLGRGAVSEQASDAEKEPLLPVANDPTKGPKKEAGDAGQAVHITMANLKSRAA